MYACLFTVEREKGKGALDLRLRGMKWRFTHPSGGKHGALNTKMRSKESFPPHRR